MNSLIFAKALEIKKRLIEEESELWSEIRFGKYKDHEMTLPLLMFRDAGWFFWAMKNDIFWGRLAHEAKDIYQKSTNIRIPKSCGKDVVVEYIVIPDEETFVDFKIVPEAQPVSTNVYTRSQVIDMSIPNRIAGGGIDKLGYKFFVGCLKFYFFGNRSHRINKARAEEFFNDESNFEGESDEAS